MKKILSLIIAQLLCIASSGYSLEPNTHELINKYVVENILNSFSLDSHLKNDLVIGKGKDENFVSKNVWEWIKGGGTYEDTPSGCIPYWRSVRHFHNPLTDAGYGPFESSISWS